MPAFTQCLPVTETGQPASRRRPTGGTRRVHRQRRAPRPRHLGDLRRSPPTGDASPDQRHNPITPRLGVGRRHEGGHRPDRGHGAGRPAVRRHARLRAQPGVPARRSGRRQRGPSRHPGRLGVHGRRDGSRPAGSSTPRTPGDPTFVPADAHRHRRADPGRRPVQNPIVRVTAPVQLVKSYAGPQGVIDPARTYPVDWSCTYGGATVASWLRRPRRWPARLTVADAVPVTSVCTATEGAARDPVARPGVPLGGARHHRHDGHRRRRQHGDGRQHARARQRTCSSCEGGHRRRPRATIGTGEDFTLHGQCHVPGRPQRSPSAPATARSPTGAGRHRAGQHRLDVLRRTRTRRASPCCATPPTRGRPAMLTPSGDFTLTRAQPEVSVPGPEPDRARDEHVHDRQGGRSTRAAPSIAAGDSSPGRTRASTAPMRRSPGRGRSRRTRWDVHRARRAAHVACARSPRTTPDHGRACPTARSRGAHRSSPRRRRSSPGAPPSVTVDQHPRAAVGRPAGHRSRSSTPTAACCPAPRSAACGRAPRAPPERDDYSDRPPWPPAADRRCSTPPIDRVPATASCTVIEDTLATQGLRDGSFAWGEPTYASAEVALVPGEAATLGITNTVERVVLRRRRPEGGDRAPAVGLVPDRPTVHGHDLPASTARTSRSRRPGRRRWPRPRCGPGSWSGRCAPRRRTRSGPGRPARPRRLRRTSGSPPVISGPVTIAPPSVTTPPIVVDQPDRPAASARSTSTKAVTGATEGIVDPHRARTS